MSRGLRSLLLAVIACGVLIAAVGAGTSQAATGPVSVFPAEGTPVASRTTQVSFRGATLSELQGASITVTGSSSGAHTGTLRAHSDGQGASFLPGQAFTAGETVTVHAVPTLPLVGAEPGNNVRFKIALPPGSDSGIPPAPKDPGGNPPGAHHFLSRPDLKPPTINVTRSGGPVAGGDYFLGIKQGKGQDGGLIASGNGVPVYFLHTHGPIFDFRRQVYNGKPVFTFWQGQFLLGVGFGHSYVYDTHYRKIKTISAGNGYLSGLHETNLTGHGTALLVFYDKVGADLSGFGGSSNSTVLDSGVQEVDLKTGLVEFEWHSVGNVPLSDAYTPRIPVPNTSNTFFSWDYTHVNSVHEANDGNLVVSARNTSAVYKVDHKTGQLIWTLGGKPNGPGKTGDFTLVGPNSNWRATFFPMPPPGSPGPYLPFKAQHDVQQQPDGAYSLFDDGSPAPPLPLESRGLILNVSETAKTVAVAHDFRHPQVAIGGNPKAPIMAFSQGSTERLSNGNYLVGWGGSFPFATEYTPTGTLIRDAKYLPDSDDTYRAFIGRWKATPLTRPSMVASYGAGHTDVYVSWNGATSVKKWRVLAGKHKNTLKVVKVKLKKGFETHIKITGHPRYVRVFAISSFGKVLGKSRRLHP